MAGGVVAALHVWKLSPALGTLSEQLNMSLGQAGVLVAVIQVAGMVLGMIVGLFNDSIGLRRGCLWGFGFLAVGSVLGAMARGPGLLLASRVLEGVGFLVVCVASPALIRRLVPPAPVGPDRGTVGLLLPRGRRHFSAHGRFPRGHDRLACLVVGRRSTRRGRGRGHGRGHSA